LKNGVDEKREWLKNRIPEKRHNSKNETSIVKFPPWFEVGCPIGLKFEYSTF